jgi:hypothetical protein
MNKIRFLTLMLSILMFVGNALSQPQLPIRTRGTITNFDGHDLLVMTREGKALKLNITDETKINVLFALNLSYIKKGSFVGVTAIQSGPGTPLQAREVHIFPESMRGTGEGHYDWDLEPGSSMTNANVDAVVATNNGKEMALSYKGGNQKIIVTEGIPIISFKPGDKSLLVVDAPVFIISQQNSNGSLVASRILVGKDGLKPPM